MALLDPPPAELELRSIVQFPHLKPGSHSLQDFLGTFTTNTTTHTVRCSRHFTTGFSDEEFVQILQAFGRCPSLRNLVFVDGGDSRLRRLRIRDMASLLSSQQQQQLEQLRWGRDWLLTGNDGDRVALANALWHHPHLRVFHYAGCGVTNRATSSNSIQLYQSIAPRVDPDAVVRALATCPRLQSVRITNSPYCAPDYSGAALVRLVTTSSSLRELSVVTKLPNWSAVLAATAADEEEDTKYAAGRSSSLERLVLTTADPHHFGHDYEMVAALMDALSHTSLHHLSLRFWGGTYPQMFPAPAAAAAAGGDTSSLPSMTRQQQPQPPQRWSQHLANALRVNQCLRIVTLSDNTGTGARSGGRLEGAEEEQQQLGSNLYPKKVIVRDATASAAAADDCFWDALDFGFLASALRDNTNLQLRLDMSVDARCEAALDRLRIESHLNAVGRGRLVQGKISTDEWLGSFPQLAELCRQEEDDGEFLQSCVYSLLRSNPLFWACQDE